ncbi:MAG: L,D-transpeptidase [Candidatus Woesearchaeota archaeon]
MKLLYSGSTQKEEKCQNDNSLDNNEYLRGSLSRNHYAFKYYNKIHKTILNFALYCSVSFSIINFLSLSILNRIHNLNGIYNDLNRIYESDYDSVDLYSRNFIPSESIFDNIILDNISTTMYKNCSLNITHKDNRLPKKIHKNYNMFYSIDGVIDDFVSRYPVELDQVNIKPGSYLIYIDKYNQKLSVYKLTYYRVFETDCSTGKNPGNKLKPGDGKTPEGIFEIISIEESDNWRYNNELAYGPWFLRLSSRINNININNNNNKKDNNKDNKTTKKRTSIGIHGTNESDKLGIFNKNYGYGASHACIRISNEDIILLKNKYAYVGMPVIITNNIPKKVYVLYDYQQINACKKLSD